MASSTYVPVSNVVLEMNKDNNESNENLCFSDQYEFYFQIKLRKCSKIKIFGDSESKNGGNSDSDSDSDSDSLISSYENGEQACTPTLLPPPIASYSTYEFLQEAIRTWTKEQGYDLVVSRSYKHNSKIVRRCLVCGRAGKSQNNRKLTENDRKRKTSTNKIGCPMGLYVVTLSSFDRQIYRV